MGSTLFIPTGAFDTLVMNSEYCYKALKAFQKISRKGKFLDNEVAENFFKILKSVLIHQIQVLNIGHVRTEILNSFKFGTTEKENIPIRITKRLKIMKKNHLF